MLQNIAEQVVTITENIPKVFQAGYEKGLAEQDIVLENKTITENGYYRPSTGTGFGAIEVQVTNADTLTNFLRNRNGSCLFANLSNSDSNIRNSLKDINFSVLTNCGYMFQNSKLSGMAPEMDLSGVNMTHYMFEGCGMLTGIPQYNISKVHYSRGMFKACANLKAIPQLDFGNGTDFGYMFNGCASLLSVPEIDTRKATDLEAMFSGCVSLKEIGGIDMRNATKVGSMFMGCISLEKVNLKNIIYSFTLGSIDGYPENMELESLINIAYELHSTSSTKTVTMGAVNLGKLSNVYVKLIPITEEMRAEDEFVDLKKPFEICDSTDEGAMSIPDYTLTKMWRLQ